MTSIAQFGGKVYTATIGDLIDLALAQPHQILLSTGSIAFMGQ